MAKRFKLNIGDVFTIPLTETEVGFGQIVYFSVIKSVFIMVAFDYKQPISDVYNIEEICKKDILFLSYSNDARLYNNLWHIVGNNTNNLGAVAMPYFKLGLPDSNYPDGARLVDYKGAVLANIDEDKFNRLIYKTEVAPIRFDNALKAHFGYEEWISDKYDELLYCRTIESVEIAKKVLSNQ